MRHYNPRFVYCLPYFSLRLVWLAGCDGARTVFHSYEILRTQITLLSQTRWHELSLRDDLTLPFMLAHISIVS